MLARTCCSGPKRPGARSRVTAAISERSDGCSRLSAGSPLRSRRVPRDRWRSRWSSASCSIANASCCRSAIGCPRARSTPNCYDLLASEARLASFIAIAKGDLPARHWFRLGRSVTPVAHGAALISWSGSMFEYLMPSLVMRAPTGSLLEQTNRLIVRRQIDYGAKLGLPWGISEVRLQCPRPGVHLPIFELRRPRPRAETWAWRERRRRTLRDRACSNGRSTPRKPQFRSARRRWRPWPLRLLRSSGLHTDPRPGGRERRNRAGFHGTSPGHDDRRHRRCLARWRDADAIPCRTHCAGD